MPHDEDHRSCAYLTGLEIERPGIDDRVLNWQHIKNRALYRTQIPGNEIWLMPYLCVPPPYTGHTRSDYFSSLNNIKINRARRHPRRRSR